MIVHCAECKHEWAAAYLPMDIDKLIPLMKGPCPRCGQRKVLMGAIPKPTPAGDALAWIGNGDTGTSSLTIWHVMHGNRPEHADIPYDPSDFGRCYRLLKVAPEWRARLHEVAAIYAEWEPLVAAWDELTALWEQEEPSGRCPTLWKRMRELRGEKVSR